MPVLKPTVCITLVDDCLVMSRQNIFFLHNKTHKICHETMFDRMLVGDQM